MTESIDPPGEAAERFAEAWGLGPPIDLGRLLGALEQQGVRIRFERHLLEAGAFRSDSGNFAEIVLRGADPLVRRKFTAAHEAGHFVARSFAFPSSRDEERWCDEFAASLLMPTYLVHDVTRDRPRTFGTVADLASAARVSYGAAVSRLNLNEAWGKVLLTFRENRGRWRLWSVLGVDRASASQVASIPEASDFLDPPCLTVHQVTVPLAISGVVRPVSGEMIGGHSNRWLMVDRVAFDALLR